MELVQQAGTETALRDGDLEAATEHYHAGRLLQAEDACRQILRGHPTHPHAVHLLGSIHYKLGSPGLARMLIGKAISLKPDEPTFHISLATIFLTQAGCDEAAASCRQALALAPECAPAHSTLGVALMMQGRHPEAMASFDCALEIDPDLAPALSNRGFCLLLEGEPEAAAATFKRSLDLAPESVRPHDQLGSALLEQGRHDEAVASFRRALRIDPDDAEVHSRLLFALHYHPGCDRAALLAEAKAWGARHAAPLARQIRRHENQPDPERRLRIGYVSGDFHRHPVGYFLEAVLRAHDRTRVEVFCYANSAFGDELTVRLRSSADRWRNLAHVSDTTADDLIRRDGIDILVDLSGHTAKNRLLVFARKPAPVQATWLGYFDTTGVASIDYLIADRFVCPESDDPLYVEKVIRLPESYLCYAPQERLEILPPPAISRGYATFGCFNKLAKITPEVVAVWAQTLQALPGARLCLKSPPLAESAVRDRYLRMFTEHGVDPDRVCLAGRSSYREYLAAYNEIDIALDPFPFNGGTTTVEAFWMGVPVITLAGDHYVSRMGVSHLSTVELSELIAESPRDYVARAVTLASDLARLAALRAGLREQLMHSALCDAPRFIRGLEAAYREMWRAWCRAPGPVQGS